MPANVGGVFRVGRVFHPPVGVFNPDSAPSFQRSGGLRKEQRQSAAEATDLQREAVLPLVPSIPQDDSVGPGLQTPMSYAFVNSKR